MKKTSNPALTALIGALVGTALGGAVSTYGWMFTSKEILTRVVAQVAELNENYKKDHDKLTVVIGDVEHHAADIRDIRDDLFRVRTRLGIATLDATGAGNALGLYGINKP